MENVPITQAEKERIVDLYRNSEMSTRAIGEQMNLSQETVSRHAKKLIPAAEYQALIKQKRIIARRNLKVDWSSCFKPAIPDSEIAESLNEFDASKRRWWECQGCGHSEDERFTQCPHCVTSTISFESAPALETIEVPA